MLEQLTDRFKLFFNWIISFSLCFLLQLLGNEKYPIWNNAGIICAIFLIFMLYLDYRKMK